MIEPSGSDRGTPMPPLTGKLRSAQGATMSEPRHILLRPAERYSPAADVSVDNLRRGRSDPPVLPLISWYSSRRRGEKTKNRAATGDALASLARCAGGGDRRRHRVTGRRRWGGRICCLRRGRWLLLR